MRLVTLERGQPCLADSLKQPHGLQFLDIFRGIPPSDKSDTPMHRRLVAVLAGLTLVISAVLSTSAIAATPLIARTVTLRATPSSPVSASDATLAGMLSGSPSKSSVVLQQLKSGSWVTLKTRTTSSTGAYSYVFEVNTAGSRTYRAYAPATKTLAAAYSATAAITVVAKPKTAFTKTVTPTVTGTRQVGQALTASTGTWSPAPATYNFQWRRNGDAITGAKSATYALTAGDHGTYVTVEVSASRSGSVTIRESVTSSTVAAGTFTRSTPTITGDSTVGHVLTAAPGTWTPQPTASTFQWTRNGAVICGCDRPDIHVERRRRECGNPRCRHWHPRGVHDRHLHEHPDDGHALTSTTRSDSRAAAHSGT